MKKNLVINRIRKQPEKKKRKEKESLLENEEIK